MAAGRGRGPRWRAGPDGLAAEARRAAARHLLLDVRERTQFEICHLPGSLNIPLADMREVLTEALKLEQRERLPPLPSSRVSEESAGGNLSSPASALTTPTPLMLPA